MPNPRPDFAQFAERCQIVKRVAQAITDYYRKQPFPSDEGLMLAVGHEPESVQFNEHGLIGESFTTQELSEFAEQAERHARLLETIAIELRALQKNVAEDYAEPPRRNETPMSSDEVALLFLAEIQRIRDLLEEE